MVLPQQILVVVFGCLIKQSFYENNLLDLPFSSILTATESAN